MTCCEKLSTWKAINRKAHESHAMAPQLTSLMCCPHYTIYVWIWTLPCQHRLELCSLIAVPLSPLSQWVQPRLCLKQVHLINHNEASSDPLLVHRDTNQQHQTTAGCSQSLNVCFYTIWFVKAYPGTFMPWDQVGFVSRGNIYIYIYIYIHTHWQLY